MNERPILSIPRTPFETSLTIISASGVIFMGLMVGLSWHELPEQVPSHFGISGQPDAWSGRSTLLILPAVAIVLWIGLTLLARIPHRFNYIVTISRENAAHRYLLARTLLSTLNAEIIVLFAYLTWQTIATARGSSEGLGTWFLPVLLLMIFSSLGVYLYRSLQTR
jgi:uncharacterized membrane protein